MTDPTAELGPFVDAESASKRLDVRVEDLYGLVQAHLLLGVETDDGSILYPAWQFGPDTAVLAGMPQLLGALSESASDGFSLATWLTSRQPRLGGRSAAEMLAEGVGLDELLEAARNDVDRLSH